MQKALAVLDKLLNEFNVKVPNIAMYQALSLAADQAEDGNDEAQAAQRLAVVRKLIDHSCISVIVGLARRRTVAERRAHCRTAVPFGLRSLSRARLNL